MNSTGGNYVDLFDAQRYYVGPVWERSQRLRVNFNGIGPFEFCPVVRRDEALALRGQNLPRNELPQHRKRRLRLVAPGAVA